MFLPGSAYYILPDPDAIKRVADRILATLRPDISRAVQQRLGIVNSWEKALSRLAKGGSPGSLTARRTKDSPGKP